MIGKFTDQLIDKCIEEFNKDENQEKLKKHILDPMIMYIVNRIYPYIIVTYVIFVLILVIVFLILLLNVRSKIPFSFFNK